MSLSRQTKQVFHKALVFFLVFTLIIPSSAGAFYPVTQNTGTFSLIAHLSAIWQQVGNGQDKKDQVPDLLLPLERPLPKKEATKAVENKEQLKARVGKFKSYMPETLEIISGDHFLLPILPADFDDNPVHGLIPEFESSDINVAMVTERGELWAGKPGKAQITVKAGVMQVVLSITVTRRKPLEAREEKIGSLNQKAFPKKAIWVMNATRKSTKPKNIVSRKVKAVTAVQQYGPPQPPSYQTTQPYNVGTPPVRTEPGAPGAPAAIRGTERPGANSFSFSAPIVSLPGRGQNLALSLFYNSVVWKKADSPSATTPTYFFDDESKIAPGFRTGFGCLRLIEQRVTSSLTGQVFHELNPDVLTDADGTKHRFYQVDNGISGTGVIAQTDDSTFIRHYSSPQNYSAYPLSDMGVQVYPDGTRVQYSLGRQISYTGTSQSYTRVLDALPVKITDRNGNYIEITYDSNNYGKVAFVRDTLGRIISFWYEMSPNGGTRLVTIEAPGFNNAATRQVIRFYYDSLTINADFQNKSAATLNPGTRDVLRYVYYPGTQNGWRFDYSSYGIVYQTKQLRGMSVSTTSKYTAGTVTGEGQEAACTIYNYPQFPSALTDVPKYTTRTDSWAGMNYHSANSSPGTPLTAPLTYQFLVDAATGTTTTTAPDGSVTISKTVSSFSSLFTNEVTQRKNGLQVKTTTSYEAGSFSSVNPRVKSVRTDYQSVDQSTGQATTSKSKQTDFTYDDNAYMEGTIPRSANNIEKVIEKDFNGNVVRTTKTTYEKGAGWQGRWLLRLPKTVEVFDPRISGGTTPVSKIEYTYDNSDTGVNGSNLFPRSNTSCSGNICNSGCNGCDDALMHDPAYNPAACNMYLDMNGTDPLDPDCFPGLGYCDPNQSPPPGWYSCDGSCSYPRCVNPYNTATNYRGNVTKIVRYGDAANSVGVLTTTYTYDITGNMVTESNGCCQTKTYTYTKAYEYAWPTAVTRGSLTSATTYDKNTGLVITSVDENGQTTGYEYYTDSLRPYQVTRPDGGKTFWLYWDLFYDAPDAAHSSNFVLTRTDTSAAGVADSYQVTDGSGRTTRTVGHQYYNGIQTIWSITDVEYDSLSRVKRGGNPFYSYAGKSAPINQSGKWTVNEYDELGRIKKVVLQDGNSNTNANVVQYDYSISGDVLTVTDQANKQHRSVLDAQGRLTEIHEPDAAGSLGVLLNPAQKTTYVYDALNNVVKITQGITPNNANGGQTRCFKYDSMGRLIFEKHVEKDAPHTTAADVLTGTTAWSKKIAYNAQGLVEDVWDARNVKTHFVYDTLKRTKEVTFTDAGNATFSPRVTYNYDQPVSSYYNAGRLTEVVTDALGAAPMTKHKYNYNFMGYVTNHVQTIGAVNYTMGYQYDRAGRMTQETYPNGRQVTYDYFAGSGLRGISDLYGAQSRTYVSNINYTAHGALSQETLGGIATRTLSYNDRLQLSGINLVQNSTQILNLTYQYGEADQATGAVNTNKNNDQIALIEGFIGGARRWQQRFNYDTLGRLSQAGEYRGDTLAAVWRAQYGYDLYGNRYQTQSSQPQNLNMSFVPVADPDIDKTRNRFAANVGYDAEGNVTTDNKFLLRTFSYDANNRVTISSLSGGGGTATSVYDGQGQRVQMTEGALTRYCIYDAAGQVLMDYENSTTVPAREYIYRGASVVATIEANNNNNVRYLAADHQGATRVQMDSTGSVLARNDYYPFGEEIAANVGMRSGVAGYGGINPVRQKYAGMERETTGTDQTLFRKYDGKSGRWTSSDPYGGSMNAGDPQSFNRYNYVQSDPINNVDPTGLDFCSAQYSYQQCGGFAGLRGGYFGDAYASRQSVVGGLSSDMAAALLQHEERVNNAFAGNGYRTNEEFAIFQSNGVKGPTNFWIYVADGLRGGSLWGNFGNLNYTLSYSIRNVYFPTNYEFGMSLLQLFGIAAVLGGSIGAAPTIAGWYMSGSEADMAWRALSFSEKVFYEIGQKTLSREMFAKFASLDPVSRGRALVATQGWIRALLPAGKGYALGAGATFTTGPTPLVRYILPRIIAYASALAQKGDAKK